jgi:hypothetical protein
MASNINPTNIDVTYPIAGQDNDTQGFRDNFTNIKNNFTVTRNEISDLQSLTSITPTITTVPVGATAYGRQGQIAYNASQFYVCIANNTWVRADLSTWPSVADTGYGNATVAIYLPVDPTILNIRSNIGNVWANIAYQASISSAALQAIQISALNANVTAANVNIATLTSNAAVQETEITGLRANIIAANSAIVTANSAAVSYVNTLNTAMTANITAANLALTNYDYPQANMYYVDASRVDTYTATGSILKPFKTITAANAAAYSAGHSDNNPAFIVLRSSITENVTLTKGGIWLTSDAGTGTHGSYILNGNITINGQDNNITNNHFALFNLRIVAGTNGKGVNFTGTNPQRIYMRDLWIDANGTGSCVYADNSGTGSIAHLNSGHLTHSAPAGNDVYCFDARAGSVTLTDIETSGNCTVGRVTTGATMTIDSSQIDANNLAACEVYGGNLVLTRSTVTNTFQYGNGINLLGAGSLVTIGDCLFNITGAGANVRAVYNYLTTSSSLNALYYQYLAFYPGSSNKITANLTATALATTFTAV